VARAPFNLQEGPLLRAILVKLSEGDHRLFLTFHQMIFDGVTAYQVFLPELADIYRAFSQNETSPLPEPAIQYADYAIGQHEEAKPEATRDSWPTGKRLAGELPVQWPSDQFTWPCKPIGRDSDSDEGASQNLKTLGQSSAFHRSVLVAGLVVLHRYRSGGHHTVRLPRGVRFRNGEDGGIF
jgi:hypothetical protein